jgi:hypothetical protein
MDRDVVGEQQARVIEYQRAENAALLERLGKHRLRNRRIRPVECGAGSGSAAC